MKNEQQHHPACPCERCKKAIEKSTAHLRDRDDDTPASRLRKLSPEAARTLGYIPPVDSDDS